MGIRAIVTDIEGTTSSLSFVHDVLFPYARAHLPEFVRQHAGEPEVRALLDNARAEAGGDLEDPQLVATLLRWIDEDRKITPLKALQGLIWEEGYRRGELQGHIYPDACERLRHWHAQGIRLYVYSSGSVKAQQLLFGHTALGDLTELFSGFFDTRIGAKREPSAYRYIAEALALPPAEILFLSDVGAELEAAQEAGMQVVLLSREGAVPASETWKSATSFAEIALQQDNVGLRPAG